MNEQTEGRHRGMSREEYEEISEKTRVPIGVAVTVAIAFIGGAIWINASLSDIKHELTDIKREMASRQSRDSLEIWIIKFRAENPNLKVPELK
jgi:cell division protein FtsL